MPNTEKIRELNDAFRKTFIGGRIVMTRGIAARDDLAAILQKVRTFDAFDSDNNICGERDFGALKIGDEQAFFKIDYYNPDLTAGSEDPSDPAVTCRVLTVMLAEEY